MWQAERFTGSFHSATKNIPSLSHLGLDLVTVYCWKDHSFSDLISAFPESWLQSRCQGFLPCYITYTSKMFSMISAFRGTPGPSLVLHMDTVQAMFKKKP